MKVCVVSLINSGGVGVVCRLVGKMGGTFLFSMTPTLLQTNTHRAT